jgi:DNA replication protein DnaC
MCNKLLESKCRELKLTAIADSLGGKPKNKNVLTMSFEDRLCLLLDEQIAQNSDRRINTLKRQANLRWPDAHISDIDLSAHKTLKQETINQLSSNEWLRSFHHSTIVGATGTGKTHLACAFANQLLLQKIPVLFIRYAELVLNLVAADSDNALNKLKRKYNRIPLMIVDDWGITPLSSQERHLLFEFVESRDQTASLMITSQYPISKWHDAFQDGTIADSVLDRIIHCSHQINLTGESHRKIRGLKGGVQ